MTMKKRILLAGFILFSAFTWAQKKEIKKADKALDGMKYAEALTALSEAEPLLGAADNNMKAHYYIIQGEVLMAQANKTDYNKLKSSAESLLKAEGLNSDGKMADRLAQAKDNLRIELVNSAIGDQNTKNYEMAAQKLTEAYNVSKKDTSYLYYAAGNLVNGQKFDAALKYYEQLLDMGYSGIHDQYSAVNKETGESATFGSKNERDNAVKLGLYISPIDGKSESVEADLLQKVTLIYMNKGDNEKALAVMNKARAANPDDTSLMRSEADLAYKMGDMEKYNHVMNEVIKTDPNNPELYYNLGVGAAQLGETEKAREYYLKALEIKPDYSFAQINMAALILQNEGKIVEEMNGLGNSKKDNLRYDELKEARKEMYHKAMPYLESATQTAPNNIEIQRTLMNIYSQLGMDDKYKAAKAKIEEMEGN
jgi:tetratricopeptide (TPR) repeat protein